MFCNIISPQIFTDFSQTFKVCAHKMKYALLVLFACVVSLHGNVHEKEDGDSSHEAQLLEGEISQGVLSLIEEAVKVAQYTKIKEKKKALMRVQVKLEEIEELLAPEPKTEPEPEPERTVYYNGMHNFHYCTVIVLFYKKCPVYSLVGLSVVNVHVFP